VLKSLHSSQHRNRAAQTNDADVSNFDRSFTSMPPVDSPIDTSVHISESFHDVFKVSCRDDNGDPIVSAIS